MAFSIYGNGVVQKRENVLFLGEGKGCVAVCFVCYHIRNFLVGADAWKFNADALQGQTDNRRDTGRHYIDNGC